MILLAGSVACQLLLIFPLRLHVHMCLPSTAADHFRGWVPPSHDYLYRLRLHVPAATKLRSQIDVASLWWWIKDFCSIGMLAAEDFPRCCGILLLRVAWRIILSKRSRFEFTLLVAWMRRDTMQHLCVSLCPRCVLGRMLFGKWAWRGKGCLMDGRPSQVTRATYSPIG